MIADWKTGTTYNVTQECIQRVAKLMANASFYNDFALHDEVTELVRKTPVAP